ncbi:MULTISPECIES: class I SAM-dependent methyltransferase [unclassified Corallococcus]|uniref:class I SAM-dependent methyltransferase n=1 Tax=unclassified Corallococcus TaxID=2685029 RepID=UPI001A8D60B2|nr:MULTISPECIES: class I SAM-dependent methyltransferase [unclassified Corallococcus]MBN9685653.1 class I SAM-dependent methyltransferase [Corallococcus sp. NCSPR001]WAS82901.1 class I SAM-dependent methyltransferase [Corallococcus sp. NCRR]
MGMSSGSTQQRISHGVSSLLRRRRLAPLLAMIEAVHRRRGRVDIVDVGGTHVYWNILPPGFLREHRAAITLINLPGGPAPELGPGFSWVGADACDLSRFADHQFDIVHSNSMIEHLGSWARMKQFAREARRLAPALFIQTPNFWFPIEPHLMAPGFHWLPVPMQAALLVRTGLGHLVRSPDIDDAMSKVEEFRLLDARTLSALFPEASILRERLGPLTKSLIAVREGTAPRRAPSARGRRSDP